MIYQCIEFSVSEKTAIIRMIRPDKLNPLDLDAGREINDVLDRIAKENSINSLIITGSGKAFSAGGDIKRMLKSIEDQTPDRFMDELTASLYDIALKLRKLKVPVIAAVNGVAVGAGMNLVLACDLVIASEKASFSQGFSKLALIPGFGGTHLLINQLPWQKAAEIAFLSDVIKPEEMQRLGLVNRVVPHENLEEEALTLAARLNRGPALVFARTKELFLKALNSDFEKHLPEERLKQVASAATEDYKAGVRALVDKKDPVFKDLPGLSGEDSH